MNRQPSPRRLIILSLIAVLVSIFSFASLPNPARAANAKGSALIARAQYGANGIRSGEMLLTMDAAGSTRILDTPGSLSAATSLSSFDAGYPAYAFISPQRLEVVDLVAGSDTFYPLPPDSGNSSSKAAGVYQPNLLSADFIAKGSQVLLSFGDYSRSIIYLLDLASGVYTHVPLTAPSGTYYAPMGRVADGMIYANVAEGRDGKVPDVVRFDLQGNVQPVNFNTGKYIRASVPTISPAGYYLYFLAYDPDQPLPSPNGPGISSNVIMRYRISDGISSVIARATRGVGIGAFTLTSDDPYITYVTGVSATSQQELIVRVNLATRGAPEPLVTSSDPLGSLLWCGSNFYYGVYGTDNKLHVGSFNPTSGATAQADGQLLGCAP